MEVGIELTIIVSTRSMSVNQSYNSFFLKKKGCRATGWSARQPDYAKGGQDSAIMMGAGEYGDQGCFSLST